MSQGGQRKTLASHLLTFIPLIRNLTVAGVYTKIYIKTVDSPAAFVALKFLCYGIFKLMVPKSQLKSAGGEEIQLCKTVHRVLLVYKKKTLIKRGN